MKAEFIKHYESRSCWAFGLHFFSMRFGTLVVIAGSKWHLSFSSKPRVFPLCFGPLSIAGAR